MAGMIGISVSIEAPERRTKDVKETNMEAFMIPAFVTLNLCLFIDLNQLI